MKKTGFTLIEMLITITIFMIFMGIALQAITLVTRNQTETNAIRKMASEVRLIESRIAELITESAVDYDCYNADITCLPAASAEQKNILALRSLDRTTRTLIRFNSDEKTITLETQKENAAGGWIAEEEISLSADSVIEHLSFLVSPPANPASNPADNTIQFQPHITMFLSARPKFQNKHRAIFHFQTSFSLRNL